MANITAVEREIRREMKKLEASPSVWEERLTTAANQREQFEDVWAACERAYFQGDHDSEEGPGVDLDVGDGVCGSTGSRVWWTLVMLRRR